MTASCTVDCAGAFVGGAARFMLELDAWVGNRATSRPTVIGRGRRLTTGWMVRRELEAPRSARRVALNNVSFLGAGGPRVVLLRNALHFSSPEELDALGYQAPLELRAQVPIVRRTARRADQVIVPCEAMAERVLHFVPTVEDRLLVRPHPVAPRAWAGSTGTSGALLVPIINSKYKRLPWHLERILDALDGSGVDEVRVTADPHEFPRAVTSDSRIKFLGALHSSDLDAHFAEVAAIYFPTQLESFGYPLAEARANGRRVVALDTPQNREIAGPALSGFTIGDTDSLRGALFEAVTRPVPPDPAPFDPAAYFSRLFDLPQ